MTRESELPNDPIPSDLVRDDDAFAELVQEFLDRLQPRLNELTVAAESQELETLQSLAHQLRGAAGGYGYPTLTQKAAELEQHAIEQDLTGIAEDLDALQQMVARVVLRC